MISVILKIINCILSGLKIHNCFKNLIKNLENDILNYVPMYYYLVQWLSINRILTKLFDLFQPVLKEKDKFFYTTYGL